MPKCEQTLRNTNNMIERKCKVTVEFTLPINEKCEVYNFSNEGMMTQEIFDEFINFAVTRHLRESTKWLAKSKEDKTSIDWRIHKKHDLWAEILDKAQVKYEFPK